MNLDPQIYRISDTSELRSPGLVIFKPLLIENLQEMLRIAGGPERLRPHCKTHKMPAVIGILLEMGMVVAILGVVVLSWVAVVLVLDFFLFWDPLIRQQ